MKILTIVRGLCLMPFFVAYGAWMLFKFTLGLFVLLWAAWLLHKVFGIAGDVMLALLIIYVLSFLLPNPRLGDIAKHLTLKIKTHSRSSVNPKTKIVDLKAYRRGAKQ